MKQQLEHSWHNPNPSLKEVHLTNPGWVATQNSITVTAHVITSEWKVKTKNKLYTNNKGGTRPI